MAERGNAGPREPVISDRTERRGRERRRGPRRQGERDLVDELTRQRHDAEEAARALQRMNAALRLGAERHRSLIAAGGDIITVKGPTGEMAEDIAGWEAFTGQTPAQWTGFGWLDVLQPDDRERLAEWWRTRPPSRDTGTLDCHIRRRDGQYRLMHVRFAPVFDAHGNVQEWLNTIIDLTDRRQTETRLRQIEEQFLQTQKMETVGRLAGGVAHDFQNLLTVIGAAAESLAAELLTPAGREDLADLRAAAAHSAALTRRLLAFSRRKPEHAEPLSLTGVVRGMESLLRRMIGSSIRLQAETGDEADCVLVDKTQVEQVLANLAVNAKDAMPEGGTLTIAVRAAEHLPGLPGRYVVLSVRDTGAGMDAATQTRIFEPFFSTKAAGQGTGLGLATVFGIVKQSGGIIRVASAPGHGTTFDVYFPACLPETVGAPSLPGATAEMLPPPSSTPVAPAGSARPAAPRASGSPRVLVVEDDPTLRRVTTRILTGQGYEVLEAEDAPAALAILIQRAQVHGGDPGLALIVTDLVMPEVPGQRLMADVHARWPHIPILAISGLAGEAESTPAFPDWVTFLPKPFGVAELLDQVRRLAAGR
jgi:PAS domain S-box-containing protein